MSVFPAMGVLQERFFNVIAASVMTEPPETEICSEGIDHKYAPSGFVRAVAAPQQSRAEKRQMTLNRCGKMHPFLSNDIFHRHIPTLINS